ncbi:efflux RND transporter periplasmic adaptor subunit [Vibrio nomapromontoriensis]|uniref:efflux RND transporter periplasmic adaptor subunit n=1 Tax=Vibrio nomapromontoriensis TaxID=2910246 RepID=UPI003D0E212E
MKTSFVIAIIGTQLWAPQTLAVELIGKTTSKNSIHVVSEVSGVVETTQWQVGDRVMPSSTLATIKDQDFKLEVAKQQANVTLVEADLNINKATYSRYQSLRAKNSLSQNELDVAKADFAASQASVALAKIELEKARLDLKNTTIPSPIDGYVVTRNVDEGSWVSQGHQLYVLTNIDKLNVRLLASEYDLNELHVGQPIQFWAEANPSHKVVATINRIGVELDTTTFAYPIEVNIDNLEHHFKPGMSVHATTVFKSH